MAERPKVGDLVRFRYYNLGAGGLPLIIFGPGAAAAIRQPETGQVSVIIKNQSNMNIEISDDIGAINGYELTDGEAIAFDVDENWAGNIYCVAVAIAANPLIVSIGTMRSS